MFLERCGVTPSPHRFHIFTLFTSIFVNELRIDIHVVWLFVGSVFSKRTFLFRDLFRKEILEGFNIVLLSFFFGEPSATRTLLRIRMILVHAPFSTTSIVNEMQFRNFCFRIIYLRCSWLVRHRFPYRCVHRFLIKNGFQMESEMFQETIRFATLDCLNSTTQWTDRTFIFWYV